MAKVALVLVLATRCSSQKSVPSDYIKPSLVVYRPAQTFPVVLGRALAHTPLRSCSVEEVIMSDSPKITQRRALTVKQILVGLAGDFFVGTWAPSFGHVGFFCVQLKNTRLGGCRSGGHTCVEKRSTFRDKRQRKEIDETTNT